MWHRSDMLAVGVLLLVALCYAPSLSGDWVWDDVSQIAHSGALERPIEWLAHDVWWLAEGEPPSSLYRPLAVITHVPGQALVGGPAIERIINLLLHGIAVVLVALIAIGAGADRRAAWLGAALLGVHPGASEAVAWISARHDLLGSVLCLAGWLALVRRNDWLAGVFLGLAPFCKESFLLAPLAGVFWMLATRRFAPRALAISLAGGVSYLGIRMLIDLPLPVGATAIEAPVAALGGVTLRGLELLTLPGAADAMPLLESSLPAGVAVLVAAVAALVLVRGRPALGAVLVPLPMLLPAVAASAEASIVGDRFFYLAFAGLAVAIGLWGSAMLARRPRAVALASLLIPVLAVGTWMRASEWTSNRSLFTASLERNPQNPYAAFRLGRDLHVRDGDCVGAIPFYEMSQSVEPRAGNNLQACLLKLGRVEAAVAMGPALVERDKVRATPATNTARGLLALNRPRQAEVWARRALSRNGNRRGALKLLGTSLGRQGRHAEALEAFRSALELDPDDSSAQAGMEVASTRLRETELKGFEGLP